MPDCKVCENQKWKDHYMMAQQRFDKVLVRLTVGFVLAFTVMMLCVFIVALMVIKTQKFISEFEYVEETEIQIEQDCNGRNIVMLPEEREVKSYGAEIYGEKEMLLEKEKDKNNTINVYK